MRRIGRQIYRYIREPHVTRLPPLMELTQQPTCEVCEQAQKILAHLYYGIIGEVALTTDCRIEVTRSATIAHHWNPPNVMEDKLRDEIIVHTRIPEGCVSPSTWVLSGWYWKDNHPSPRQCAATTVTATLFQPDTTTIEMKQRNMLILKYIWRFARDIRLNGMAWMSSSRFRGPDAEFTKLLVAIGPHSPSPSTTPYTAICILEPSGPKFEYRAKGLRAAFIANEAEERDITEPDDQLNAILEELD